MLLIYINLFFFLLTIFCCIGAPSFWYLDYLRVVRYCLIGIGVGLLGQYVTNPALFGLPAIPGEQAYRPYIQGCLLVLSAVGFLASAGSPKPNVTSLWFCLGLAGILGFWL